MSREKFSQATVCRDHPGFWGFTIFHEFQVLTLAYVCRLVLGVSVLFDQVKQSKPQGLSLCSLGSQFWGPIVVRFLGISRLYGDRFLVALQNLDFCGLRTELLSADQDFSSQPSGDVGLHDLSGIA